MCWLNKILGSIAKPVERVQHPGGGFESAAAAIAELLRKNRAASDDGWAQIEASIPGRTVTVQVMRDQLNLLLEELPPHAGEALDLERINEGLYRMADASPEGIAATIDALINVHFGLGAGYAVVGKLDG